MSPAKKLLDDDEMTAYNDKIDDQMPFVCKINTRWAYVAKFELAFEKLRSGVTREETFTR